MPDTVKRVTSKDQLEKIERKRLAVLELAEKLGNISEACRQSSMDRPSFYIWKKRFEERGLEGLKDLPKAPHSHPAKTTPAAEKKILKVSLMHPDWGCKKVSKEIRLFGVSISSPTVQKIFIKHNLARVLDRTLHLEKRYFEAGAKLNEEQIRVIERINPIFRERNEESSGPGELLCQAVKSIGTLNGIGKIYAHCVVDTFNSFGFAYLHTGKLPEAAEMLLKNDVFPKYNKWELEIKKILTNTGSTFSNPEEHHYKDFLWLNDIEHWKYRTRGSKTNGFVERFIHTLKTEFVPGAFHKKIYTSIKELQQELDEWLHGYNYNCKRLHRGYRNNGKNRLI